MKYSISTDKSKLNVEAIHDFLCHDSYWAKGRNLDSVEKSIENSMCFGLYNTDEKMMGFGRVVTDKVVFAYLMDFFVFEDYRGKGLGKTLMKYILEHADLQVKVWFLATESAHGLYEKYGFSGLADPERYMIKLDNRLC